MPSPTTSVFSRSTGRKPISLPGLPCLFSGDEVGAEFQPYETTGPIDWTDRHELRSAVKQLIHLRQQIPPLHATEWQPLAVEPATPLLAYLRTASNGQAVVVILNFSETAREATVRLPAETAWLLGVSPLADLWSGERCAAPESGRLHVSLPGWGFRFQTNDAVNG